MEQLLHILRFGVLADLREQHPEVQALVGCPQDSEWHPEGDAFAHTHYVIAAMRRVIERDGVPFGSRQEARLLLAALCHDLGKPATTTHDPDGRIRARGHDEAGVQPTLTLMGRCGVPATLRGEVVQLVRLHMVHLRMAANVANVQKILAELGDVPLADLDRVVEADVSGRPPLPARKAPRLQEYQALEWQARQANERAAIEARRKAARLVTGQVLIDAGLMEPGPRMGKLIHWLDMVQEDGGFSTVEDGLDLARVWLEVMA